jgi:hypothetical protein
LCLICYRLGNGGGKIKLVETTLIILTILVSWIIYSRLRKKQLNKKAIGRLVTLVYADQNAIIEKELPRTGKITKTINVEGKIDNFVVDLDQPFYFDNYDFKEIVIRERHAGHYIGSNEETHVHLLLPRVKLMKDQYKFDDFSHVAWLIVKLR